MEREIAQSLMAISEPPKPLLVTPMNIIHAKRQDSFLGVHSDALMIVIGLIVLLVITDKLKPVEQKYKNNKKKNSLGGSENVGDGARASFQNKFVKS
jgi:hypothetical protein